MILSGDRRVVVTGAGGFIGHHLVKRLKADGLWVRGVDIKHPEYERSAADEFYISDLREFENCVNAVAGMNDVYNLAADMGGIGYITSIHAELTRNNILINSHMLEASKLANIDRYLYTSSACVYPMFLQHDTDVTPLKEEQAIPADPERGYGWEKLFAEQLTEYYGEECGLDVRIVRFHNIYGPRMGFDHVIPELMQRIFNERDPFPVFGLDQTRAFCYVSDAVDAMIQLMGCQLESDLVVHIGNSDEEILIKDLLSKLMTLTGFNPEIEAFPAPVGAVDRRCPDTQKLHRLTGYYPKINLDKGLALTWDWYKERLKLEASKIP